VCYGCSGYAAFAGVWLVEIFMQFMFWAGLVLTVAGLAFALLYIPVWLAAVLIGGVVCLALAMLAAMQSSHRQELARFKPSAASRRR
jgi:hypothetical protein